MPFPSGEQKALKQLRYVVTLSYLAQTQHKTQHNMPDNQPTDWLL
jgi:hypothetical protein